MCSVVSRPCLIFVFARFATKPLCPGSGRPIVVLQCRVDPFTLPLVRLSTYARACVFGRVRACVRALAQK